jgi:hypothetical protein
MGSFCSRHLCLLISQLRRKTGVKIVNEGISLLPNIILGFVIFGVFLLAGSIASSVTRRVVQRRRIHQGMILLLGRLVHTSIVVIGFLIAFSVVTPSFHAADLIKLLGIGSVAIGKSALRYSFSWRTLLPYSAR